MWRSKKLVLIAVLATAVLAGSIGGIVYAQENGDEDVSPKMLLLERVADKLGIDHQQLKDAFAEAIGEIRDEAQNRMLEKAVEQGWITPEEAEEYSEWWVARPDVKFGFGGIGQLERRGCGGPWMRGGCGFGIWCRPEAD